jgi:predicted nucleic acid-binding protein
LFASIVGNAPEPKWVAVLDTSVLVPAARTERDDTINVKVVRAAITGLYECVLSLYIQEEVREVLQRPEFGFTMPEIEAKFAPLWTKARVLEPVPYDDPQLLKVVHGDSDDLPVLATGLAAKADELLGPLPTKFLVSNNSTDFTPGQKPFGLHFVTAQMFWHYLERGAKAKLP